ncbi:MAG TPA: hypothetical protein VIL49_11080, partial [Capillimicrobium sp.]
MSFITIGIEIGLLYAPLALGIYLALRVLSLPDLTLEGSFGIGGAATAGLLAHGSDPLVSLLGGMAAGACAGLVTAMLHLRLRMNVLLAGILMTTAAWSISLIIMGSGNVPLLTEATLFSWAQDAGLSLDAATLAVGGSATALVAVALAWFLHTDYGLSMRASGLSIQTARGFGVRTEARQVVGLMLANALAAASGGLVVQSQGFMDVSIQVGVIVVGLAALMIGQAVIRSPRPIPAIAGVLIGVVVYRMIVAWTIQQGMNPNYVRLVTALVVVVVIAARTQSHGLVALPGTARAR